jgi:hypothetical protein
VPHCHCNCRCPSLLAPFQLQSTDRRRCPLAPCPIAIAVTMSSNQKKRGSSPGTTKDKTSGNNR